jgi:hypothetical protein
LSVVCRLPRSDPVNGLVKRHSIPIVSEEKSVQEALFQSWHKRALTCTQLGDMGGAARDRRI